jgi:Zn finger protein HypA/HybF involved in hydrogenase expression
MILNVIKCTRCHYVVLVEQDDKDNQFRWWCPQCGVKGHQVHTYDVPVTPRPT